MYTSSVSSIPGSSSKDRFVLSRSSLKPHAVTAKQSRYICDEHCFHFQLLSLFSHTVVVAQANSANDLRSFLGSICERVPNLYSLGKHGLPPVAGKKGNRPPCNKSTKVAPISFSDEFLATATSSLQFTPGQSMSLSVSSTVQNTPGPLSVPITTPGPSSVSVTTPGPTSVSVTTPGPSSILVTTTGPSSVPVTTPGKSSSPYTGQHTPWPFSVSGITYDIPGNYIPASTHSTLMPYSASTTYSVSYNTQHTPGSSASVTAQHTPGPSSVSTTCQYTPGPLPIPYTTQHTLLAFTAFSSPPSTTGTTYPGPPMLASFT